MNLLRKLGLQGGDRAVIFHADDIGMCQAANDAYQDLVEFGLLSSAAVMVPCPWFRAAASYAASVDAARIDLGVHLTLTSEWQGYRWSPVSTADPATGFLDEQGCFHRECPSVQERATLAAVEAEVTAQIERALAAGIDVTHIDTHMGSIVHPRFGGTSPTSASTSSTIAPSRT